MAEADVSSKKSSFLKFKVSVPSVSVSFKLSDTTIAVRVVDHVEDEVNVVRFNCMQSWYLAASQKNKEQFLCNLLERTTIKVLLIFLKTLDCRTDKIHVYTAVHQTTNFIYDKNLKDHNRSLEETYLETIIKAELEWYCTLNEYDQLHIIFKLLKISGGALMWNIFHKALNIYQLRQIENTEKTVRLKDDNHLEVYKKIMSYEVKDSQSVETEKARKRWNETINKYRIQIEGKPKVKQTNETKQKIHKEKSSKVSKKNEAKSTKTTGKQTEDQFMIDRIQLLPVWIVKQIFSFLDQKTLKKMKTVNSYWAYVIDDMLKEKASRKYIDKTLKKMQNNINSIGITELPKEEKTSHKLSRISALEKRLYKLAGRGAIDTKLLSTDHIYTLEKSLVTDATFEKKAQYILPVNKLYTFPRNIPVNSSLHKSLSCVQNEALKNTEQSSTSTSMSEEVSSDSVIHKITLFN